MLAERRVRGRVQYLVRWKIASLVVKQSQERGRLDLAELNVLWSSYVFLGFFCVGAIWGVMTPAVFLVCVWLLAVWVTCLFVGWYIAPLVGRVCPLRNTCMHQRWASMATCPQA